MTSDTEIQQHPDEASDGADDARARRQDGPGERAKQREAERKARAAQKLRENLQRRKQQARSRRAGEADETDGLPAAKTNESY